MLSVEQLSALLRDIESDRVERTVSVNDTDKFAQAVCAFANDLPDHREPGYLIVGAAADGSLCGLNVADQLLQNLGALRSDGNFQPLPSIAVTKQSLPGGDLAVVEVQPSHLPPVRYKGQVWIRVGPRKRIAYEQDERILTEKRISRARSFDASPIKDASVDDLSLAIFGGYREGVVDQEVILGNRRTMKEQMASLRFFDPVNDCPTVAGVLLFGRDPRRFVPGGYVQYLRLPGNALIDRPDDQAEVSGDLLAMLRELIARVKSGIHTSLESISAFQEKMQPDYPEIAVHEILMNAVLHRDYRSNTPVRFYWYADRIEIQSPGGLYGEVTAETLTSRSSYRNPVLAEAMKALGYVNRFGYGIQRAMSALDSNGNPPLTIETDSAVFKATLRRRAD